MRPYYFDFERYRSRGPYACTPCEQFLELLQAAAATVGLWRQRVRERGELARLDRRLLRDIGVAAHEADAECNKPFWRA